jgi:hypothetical protein
MLYIKDKSGKDLVVSILPFTANIEAEDSFILHLRAIRPIAVCETDAF